MNRLIAILTGGLFLGLALSIAIDAYSSKTTNVSYNPPTIETSVESNWEEIKIAGKTAYLCSGPPEYFPNIACHYIYFRGKGWMALPIKSFSEIQVAMIIEALND